MASTQEEPMRGRGAVVGIGEIPPQRNTEGEDTLSLIAKAGLMAIEDSGLSFEDVDGMLVHPIGGISMLARKRCCICESCPFDLTASTKAFVSSPDASASR